MAEENFEGEAQIIKDHMEEAKRIMKLYPLMDGHNDLPWGLRNCFENKWSKLDLTKNWSGVRVDGVPWEQLHTDIPRLKEGCVGAQFWSVFIPANITGAEAIQLTLEQIDVVHRMCEKYPETFEMAYTAQQVRDIFKAGKIPSMCGIEGGHQIGGSLRALRMFHMLGARYMTLTHNGGPGWGDPAVELDGSWCNEAPLGGLNDFGCAVVKEMNRVGMVVDISHVHEVTMAKALDVTRAPVMFSHSSTRALCGHPRDVPDEILCRLKENGGVCMIVFLSKFVAGEFWVSGGKVGATVIEVADHVDHCVKIAGIDHVGIGGDYDGGQLFARGLEDVSKYPVLICELLKRGYTEEQLGKLLGLNVIRVLEDCERVSRELKAAGELASEEHWGPEVYVTNMEKEKALLQAEDNAGKSKTSEIGNEELPGSVN